MKNSEYKSLLSTFNELQKNNDEKKKQGIHDYSLINALLKKNDEVNLHSNFIYSMINPKSSHYCGNIFLELFLEAINEANFINLSNARVHKEKGKIDLLIEDGDRVIIIENKLRAPDQPYQFSRYIQYAIDTYLQEDYISLDKKIRVIYLSEYKATPSKKSESIIGFTLKDGKLKWNNNPIYKEANKKDKTIEKLNLDLHTGTQLKFNRVQHSKHLLSWVFLAKDWLSQNKANNVSRGLDYAFDEYKLILNRLNTKEQWRNVMSLDSYTLAIEDENEQEKMYAFMCEANDKFNNYLAEKLYREIDELFSENERRKLILQIKPNEPKIVEFDEFTITNCRNWFKQNKYSENYRDIGFVFKEDYYFGLGKDNISYGLCSDGWKSDINNRENLKSNKDKEKNLFTLIRDLKSYRQIIST